MKTGTRSSTDRTSVGVYPDKCSSGIMDNTTVFGTVNGGSIPSWSTIEHFVGRTDDVGGSLSGAALAGGDGIPSGCTK